MNVILCKVLAARSLHDQSAWRSKTRPWCVFTCLLCFLSLNLTRPAHAKQSRFDAAELAKSCGTKEGYSDAAPPARIYGNTYYVGTCGITSILIVGRLGDVLIDGGPKEAAPLILTNLIRMGVRPQDVKIILSSHEHFDHVGGLAELKRVTGAKVYARAAVRRALEDGLPSPSDPQRRLHQVFPPLHVDGLVPADGRVELGPLKLTMIASPGHTPGSTTWTWKSCEGDHCLTIVYGDSLSTGSADTYRFSDHPEEVAAFKSTIDRIAALSCDILVTPHPGLSSLFERFAGKQSLVNADGCADYARRARTALEARLDKERARN